MPHDFQWKDDECAGVSCALGDDSRITVINIYEWTECEVCEQLLKLRQVNEILEKEFDHARL